MVAGNLAAFARFGNEGVVGWVEGAGPGGGGGGGEASTDDGVEGAFGRCSGGHWKHVGREWKQVFTCCYNRRCALEGWNVYVHAPMSIDFYFSTH